MAFKSLLLYELFQGNILERGFLSMLCQDMHIKGEEALMQTQELVLDKVQSGWNIKKVMKNIVFIDQAIT